MNNRLQLLHNKTQVVGDAELPYNSSNKLLTEDNLRDFFDRHGLAGVPFNNINLYRNAFVHRSYITMKNDDFESGNDRCPTGCLPLQNMSYERLEFLGDAILGMVVARYLYERYPDQPEGFLSRMRTKLVNGKMLGYLSEKIGFPRFAIVSKQIEDSQGRSNYKIMEDIFEAFIGALYMDFDNDDDGVVLPSHMTMAPNTGTGYFIAEQWIITIMETYLDFAELIQSKTNYKDTLVRHMQYTFQDLPRFYEVSVDTKNNRKIFTYCVKDKANAVLGTGNGASAKEAQNNAACEALKFYGIDMNAV
jgi:ribonuclease-3